MLKTIEKAKLILKNKEQYWLTSCDCYGNFNRKEFANGTKYPYGVNGMGAGESGILWAFDFESYAEY